MNQSGLIILGVGLVGLFIMLRPTSNIQDQPVTDQPIIQDQHIFNFGGLQVGVG